MKMKVQKQFIFSHSRMSVLLHNCQSTCVLFNLKRFLNSREYLSVSKFKLKGNASEQSSHHGHTCCGLSSIMTLNNKNSFSEPKVNLTNCYRHIQVRNFLSRVVQFNCLCSKTDIPLTKVSPRLCKSKHSIRFCSQCTFVHHKIPHGFRTQPPWRILFFGTDEFAVATLRALNENRLERDLRVVDTLSVVSVKGKTAVRRYANESGLTLYDWPIQTYPSMFDVGILVSFGQLIPSRIIHMFPYGVLNVHPSLLPRWRGASPIIHTILSGDSVTGISLMEIRPKHFDIGPLLMQKEIPVPKSCTSKQLSDILAPLGASMAIQSLFDLPRLERLEVEQEYRGVTYAHKIKPEMAIIDWENQTVEQLDRLSRGISEIIPLRTEWNGSCVKLLGMSPPELLEGSDLEIAVIKHFHTASNSLPPGTPFYYKAENLILVKCKDGWVGFHKVVHKKALVASEFYNGYLSKKENRGLRFGRISQAPVRTSHTTKKKQSL